MSASLTGSLTLPCGTTIRNRIAKSAMTEGLADARGRPTEGHVTLYKAWADGGAGLLITGNVMIDIDHLERPGNVVIQREPDDEMRKQLKAWAEAGTRNNTQLWMQISHAGRQTQALVNPHPKAPSAVPLGLPGKQFGVPVPLAEAEIEDLITRFAVASKAARDAGFTGVQIHAAHGYLISQFLNPRANLRTDKWGGSLENRARFLLEAVKRTRTAVGAAFAISVKLNSADFQKGGFAFEDSLVVAKWLEEASVDLIEVSGGSYEQPKMMNIEGMEAPETQKLAASTAAREAYFVDFAKAMRNTLKIPVLLTGGIRQRQAALHALESNAADMVGLARPMCVDMDAPNQWIGGTNELTRWEGHLKLLPTWANVLRIIPVVRALEGFAIIFWYYAQIYRLARGEKADRELSVFAAFREVDAQQRRLAREISAAKSA
ncbi:MAG: NADH:flavin oxidoreductase/NADH oxidase family protein [Micropepsaceae bacterium]